MLTTKNKYTHAWTTSVYQCKGDVGDVIQGVEPVQIGVFLEARTDNKWTFFALDNRSITDRVEQLVKNWEIETAFTSNLDQIVQNNEFRQIVGLGEPAIPIIINHLKRHPSYLVWALKEISRNTLFSPPPEQNTFEDTVNAWIKWGEELDYI